MRPTFMVVFKVVCIAVASFAEEIAFPAAFGLAFFVVFFEELLLIRDFFVIAIFFFPQEVK